MSVIIRKNIDITENEYLISRYKEIRNNLLFKCDWTQGSDSPLTPEKKAEWVIYRQALRDFPETCDPYNPVWPTSPT
jgi:hypothetical protein